MACGGLGGWVGDGDDWTRTRTRTTPSPPPARAISQTVKARAHDSRHGTMPLQHEIAPAAPSSSSSQQIERGPVSDRMPSRLFLGARAVAVAHTNTLTCLLEDACPPGYDRSLVNRARGRHTTQLCPDTVVGLCPFGTCMVVSWLCRARHRHWLPS